MGYVKGIYTNLRGCDPLVSVTATANGSCIEDGDHVCNQTPRSLNEAGLAPGGVHIETHGTPRKQHFNVAHFIAQAAMPGNLS